MKKLSEYTESAENPTDYSTKVTPIVYYRRAINRFKLKSLLLSHWCKYVCFLESMYTTFHYGDFYYNKYFMMSTCFFTY